MIAGYKSLLQQKNAHRTFIFCKYLDKKTSPYGERISSNHITEWEKNYFKQEKLTDLFLPKISNPFAKSPFSMAFQDKTPMNSCFSSTKSSFLEFSSPAVAVDSLTISAAHWLGKTNEVSTLSSDGDTFFRHFLTIEELSFLLCEENLISLFPLRVFDLSFISCNQMDPLATGAEPDGNICFCLFLMQISTLSAALLLFLFRIPHFPFSLTFKGEEIWVDIPSRRGRTSDSLLSDTNLAFDELSLWLDFDLRPTEEPCIFFLGVFCGAVLPDEWVNSSKFWEFNEVTTSELEAWKKRKYL